MRSPLTFLLSSSFSSLFSHYIVPPIVTVENNEVMGVVNRPLTLNCEADGYPMPRIYWTKAGRAIETQPG